MLTKNTDVIRTNSGDFVNITNLSHATRENSLILGRISADNVYSFDIRFGRNVDAETVKEMQGTYWASVQTSVDDIDNIEIVTL